MAIMHIEEAERALFNMTRLLEESREVLIDEDFVHIEEIREALVAKVREYYEETESNTARLLRRANSIHRNIDNCMSWEQQEEGFEFWSNGVNTVRTLGERIEMGAREEEVQEEATVTIPLTVGDTMWRTLRTSTRAEGNRHYVDDPAADFNNIWRVYQEEGEDNL